MVVMIDEVKFIFYSVLVGKGARESVLWLARLLAGSLHRGVPLVVLIDEVKFIFYSVLVGKGAREISRALARAATRRLAICGRIMIKQIEESKTREFYF